MTRAAGTGPGARRRAAGAALAVLLALAVGASSCAYYNTFYLARKNYFKATSGKPYVYQAGLAPAAAGTPAPTGTPPPGQPSAASATAGQYYQRSIDYSKKLLANYPKSKWVDDAYLLWARSLLGREDPLQTVNMLADFDAKYPGSEVAVEARFYLGVAYRRSRQYNLAVETLQGFAQAAPKSELVPYAQLELAQALTALERHDEAAAAAGQALAGRKTGGDFSTTALQAQADAYFRGGEYAQALAAYRSLGEQARSDDERFDYLLREEECLEAAGRYDEALALLQRSLAYEREPARQDTTGGRIAVAPTGPGVDRYGRLLLRVGSVQQRQGQLDAALASYRRVLEDYPRSALGAEAQYRIGYAYETLGDDFDRAREEYARVKDQAAGGPFAQQAQQRLTILERLEQFKSAGGDTLQKIVEQGFLRAEVYLFQNERPDRALEEYQRIAAFVPGTPWAGKAINAQGWVLARKLDQPARAESLWWLVVREYPATEAQLAARDYLEGLGQVVPDSLIRFPVAPAPVAGDTARAVPDTLLLAPDDTLRTLPPFPGAVPDSLARADSLARVGPAPPGTVPVPGRPGARAIPPTFMTPPAAPPAGAPAPPDTARPPAVPAPPDTARPPAPEPASADTTRRDP